MSRPELARYGSGLRHSTPGNVPCIVQSKVGRLFLNAGHGMLGWTHGCGSGRSTSEIISGRRPTVDFAFY